ncbi:primosomal protein N' [Kordiimonas lacus]|uniref:Replication restart protein PriA n=1 Tax=Kordiimonas lacus TaxID=637679 RepID=A0A1G7A1A5_9PROT|nr:primosomal protein N' [Kordiimonas lacus]SDE08560.1 replication restart DNA helicase PriA [Kordiimonas lacus]
MSQQALNLGIEEPPQAEEAGARVQVLLPLPLAGPLDYRVPDGMANQLEPGAVVEVPLSGRKAIGVVWPKNTSGKASGKTLPLKKLKPVERIIDVPPFGTDLTRFVDWVSAYTLSSQGAVLRMCLSVPAAFGDVPVKRHYACASVLPDGIRMTPAREAVLKVLADGKPRMAPEIASLAGVSDGVVRGLADAGALVALDISVDQPYPQPDTNLKGPKLSGEQTEAAEAIRGAVWEGGFKPFLLDGITGSGKTEVYFEGLAEALQEKGTQVLVLVPEIALTSQWLERFEARFGVTPVVWHSEVGQAERRRAWRAVATGDARVVVGARSALFLPFKKLAFITVDEEHDPSFKQEEGVLYHARDMAVVRAMQAGCPVVLASATPSLETQVNADEGKYQVLKLRERHGVAVLPEMRAVDMRAEPPEAGTWLSPILVREIEETLAAGEQVMLFLNRRGYAPLTLCRTCGHRIECPSCSAWLVEHRFRQELQCHHCGHMEPIPEACPTCESKESLVACGPGVERLFEEVTRRFSEARTSVMTSDTMMSPSQTAAVVKEIAGGHLDIVIGTQIVTKGYHFPNLTLVGVVDADLGLRGGDLRAGERTYQQLVQVAGRAGRAEKPGKVLLQSYEPEHPVVQALLTGDGDAFMAAEKAARAQYHMPPYGKLVAIILSGPEMAEVLEVGRALAKVAPVEHGVDIVGPAPAPMVRIRGQHRFRMLLHAKKHIKVQQLVRNWVLRVKPKSSVRIKVDIDPYSFM